MLVPASADEAPAADLTFTISGGRAEITGIKNAAEVTVVELPSEIDGAGVTGIGAKAFYDVQNIIEVILPETVEYIGAKAFARCFGLKKINFPDGLERIEEEAFCNANSLLEAMLPDSVTYLGDRVFESCTWLQKARIPSGFDKIGNYVFHSCSTLKSIELPDKLVAIGDYAFANCSNLKVFTCEAAELPELGTDIFSVIGDIPPLDYATPINEATLFVPEEVVEKYKAADQWDKFGSILPICETKINTISRPIDESRKLLFNGYLFILLNENIYNAMGYKVQ